MFHIIEILLPVVCLIGTGYVLTQRSLISSDHVDGLMWFAQSVAIPCLLFVAISRVEIERVLQPEFLASFYLASTVTFLLGTFGARIVFGRSGGESVSIGFVTLYSNNVLVGLPILDRAYGAESLASGFVIVSLHAPFCYCIGIVAMEVARANGRGFTATALTATKTMFSNVLTLAIVFGFLVNVTETPVPAFFTAATELFAQSALPVALFSLGGVLVRFHLKDSLRETVTVCFLKLVIHPGIAYVLATRVFELDPAFTRAVVVLAAMAPGVNGYVFATMYNRARNTAASAVLAGTALSVLSASFWLAFLGV